MGRKAKVTVGEKIRAINEYHSKVEFFLNEIKFIFDTITHLIM